jgi:hypothetical protein
MVGTSELNTHKKGEFVWHVAQVSVFKWPTREASNELGSAGRKNAEDSGSFVEKHELHTCQFSDES